MSNFVFTQISCEADKDESTVPRGSASFLPKLTSAATKYFD